MLKVALSLFLSGLFLAAGPCLVSCGPFLISFVAGNKKDLKQSLGIWFIFSLSRIFAYIVLGSLAGVVSQEFIYKIYEGSVAKYILILGGSFVLLMGLLMLLGKNPQLKICEVLKNKFIKNDAKSIIAFGLLVGFLPCPPLLGILAYIAMISASVFKGIFYSLSFGIGTLVSPLIIMVITASFISKILGNQERLYSIFQKICAVIILFLGLQLIYRGFNI